MSTQTKKDAPGEQDWFFDMIINFLRSPRWKTPVMTFLDDNCIIFDTEEENKLEYTTIHNNFKKLVEGLLDELMSELGVTNEQFYAACEKATGNPLHKKIVDQLVAVDNFIAFKKLMMRRNQELNEQVLKMMAQKEKAKNQPPPNAPPGTSVPPGTQPPPRQKPHQQMSEEEKKAEEEMIKRALTESMNLEQQKKQEIDEEEEMIKRAIELSQVEEQQRQEKVRQQIQDSQLAERQVIDQSKNVAQPVAAPQQPNFQQQIAPQQELPPQQQIPPPQQQVTVPQQQQPVSQQQPPQQQEQVKQPSPEARVKKPKQEKPKQEVQKEPIAETAKPNKQSAEKKQAFDLPPVAMKRGGGAGFEFDTGLLKEQQKVIDQMKQKQADQDYDWNNQQQKDPNEGKSFKDLLKEKREATEKSLQGKQPQAAPQGESVEERRQRLKAQRDLLVKMKNDKRQQELGEFNDKITNKDDLHKELLEMDKKIKPKQQRLDSHLEEEKSLGDSPDVDKRLAIYKRMRQDLMDEENKQKQESQKQKMDDLNAKISKLEQEKQSKAEEQQKMEDDEKKKQQERGLQNSNFLGNIKSFNVVEDF